MRRIIPSITAAAIGVLLLAGCSAASTSEESAGVIEITCATCQESTTDPFLQYNFEAAQRFNEQFEGEFRVDTLQNANAGSSPERLQYYQRLALADDLPDVFQLNSAEIKSLATTGALRDFSSTLAEDDGWRESFKPNAFDALSGDDGETWAIPQQQDAIGLFYNKSLLAESGFDTLPTTWDEFDDLAGELKSRGVTPIALDGGWATILMWSNLIGTSPGGPEFLGEEIATSRDWSDNDAVVEATERLRDWHVDGYVNADAFSGDFQNAASKYLAQQAAIIPNGPWFVKTNIQTENAAPGLYENSGYAPSPGWSDGEGLVVVSGAGWASGAGEKAKEAAVDAFVKFMSSDAEAILQAEATGSNPPISVDPAELAAADLEQLSAGLAAQIDAVPHTYPHARVRGGGGIDAAWKNLWPAYVKGDIDTSVFLSRLATESVAGS